MLHGVDINKTLLIFIFVERISWQQIYFIFFPVEMHFILCPNRKKPNLSQEKIIYIAPTVEVFSIFEFFF